MILRAAAESRAALPECGAPGAPRNFVPSVEGTPECRGGELPLRERGDGAPPFSTSRGQLGALPPPAEGEQLPSRARRRVGERRGGGSEPPPPQRGRDPRAQLAAPAWVASAAAGTPRSGLPCSLS